MSFLWYWPLPKDLSGFWDFDKWKAKQTWQPMRSEQSGTHLCHAMLLPRRESADALA